MRVKNSIYRIQEIISPFLNSSIKNNLEQSIDYWLGTHEGSILIGNQFQASLIKPIYIFIKSIYGFHTVIVGSTRSGKTTTAKTIIYYLLEKLKFLHITIFDLENEFDDFNKYQNCTVYDLECLSWAERYALMLQELIRANAKSKSSLEQKELFVFDELQYLASEINESNAGMTKEEIQLRWEVLREFINFLQRSLKRNTSSINISPSIARVTKAVFDLCRNKIVHRLEPREIETHLSKVSSSLTHNQESKLSKLQQGMGYLIGEIINDTMPILCKIKQFEHLKTYSMV